MSTKYEFSTVTFATERERVERFCALRIENNLGVYMYVIRHLPHRPMVYVFLVFLIFEAIYFPIKNREAERALSAFGDGDQISISGTLYKTEYKNEAYRYYIKNLSISNLSYPGKALILTDTDEYSIGTKLNITGTIKPFSVPENDGGFDERTYYKGQGIFLRIKNPSFIVEGQAVSASILTKLMALRDGMKCFYDDVLPMEEAGILAAMTLGDKASMDEDAKTLFQEAGLAHILAVSGLHISIVGMGLFRLLKKMGMGYLPCGVTSSIFVFLYGLMTGFSISTFRAIVMFFVMMLSVVLGDAYDLISSLLFALMVVLAIEPMAPYNSGFLFSFGAVFGISLCATPLCTSYERLCKKRYEKTLRYRQGRAYRPTFRESFIKSVLFSLGIQMFTIPLVALFYYEIPIYVVGLNLILIPLLSVIIGVGLVGGIIGAALGTGGWILLPCHIFLYFYEMASDASLHLPFARVVVGHPAPWRVVAYYALLLLAVWRGYFQICRDGGIWNTKKRKNNFLNRIFFCFFKSASVFSNRSIKHKMIMFAYIVAGNAMLAFSILAISPIARTKVHMLSVGQGDGIVIFSKEGATFCIDGGSSSKSNIGKYVLKPFLSYHGKDKVDYWFLTHLDNDHISGCMELLMAGHPIKNLVLTETLKTEDDAETREKYQELLSLCEQNGTQVIYMRRGDACGTKTLSFLCLSPSYPSAFSGANENSMVLKMTFGEFDILLTGDIGEEQERALLLNQGDVLGDIEILKAAHHGSNGSNCEAWLQTIAPGLCIISAGKNNVYGHPGTKTLARLKEEHIPYLCTIDSGQISLLFHNGKMQVSKYHQ